ncbi:hypothetical protein [Pseudomonas sp. BBP2017]|uniref:hypothetical protein n=1 Tax=Pseudomonas sp. BBP2017 TaxID=2109731 RepID=UPI0021148FCB|nr:hypothetical protein [Pseudomonas sp. BBP2017]
MLSTHAGGGTVDLGVVFKLVERMRGTTGIGYSIPREGNTVEYITPELRDNPAISLLSLVLDSLFPIKVLSPAGMRLSTRLWTRVISGKCGKGCGRETSIGGTSFSDS